MQLFCFLLVFNANCIGPVTINLIWNNFLN